MDNTRYYSASSQPHNHCPGGRPLLVSLSLSLSLYFNNFKGINMTLIELSTHAIVS